MKKNELLFNQIFEFILIILIILISYLLNHQKFIQKSHFEITKSIQNNSKFSLGLINFEEDDEQDYSSQNFNLDITQIEDQIKYLQSKYALEIRQAINQDSYKKKYIQEKEEILWSRGNITVNDQPVSDNFLMCVFLNSVVNEDDSNYIKEELEIYSSFSFPYQKRQQIISKGDVLNQFSSKSNEEIDLYQYMNNEFCLGKFDKLDLSTLDADSQQIKIKNQLIKFQGDKNQSNQMFLMTLNFICIVTGILNFIQIQNVQNVRNNDQHKIWREMGAI